MREERTGRVRRGYRFAVGGLITALVLSAASIAVAEPDWEALAYTPIHTMQAVNTNGSPAWSVPVGPPPDYEQGYKLRGVVINNPADMLDGTPDYAPEGPLGYMGGQWQIFIQAVGLPDDPAQNPELVGDVGGACLWMGQNYGNHIWHYPDPTYSYKDGDWLDELDRLNHPVDVDTGLKVTEPLRVGDLVEVHARGGLHYKGKFNVNEQHDNDSSLDFDIVLLDRDLAVSTTSMHLSEVKDLSNQDIFVPARTSGGELYQGRRVRLEGVSIEDASQWGVYGVITVSDGTGRTLPVHLGVRPEWDTTAPPTGTFDLIGVFDQESTSVLYGTDGYFMWALSPAAFTSHADLDGDGFVGAADLDIVRAWWGQAVAPGDLSRGDVSGDGRVGGADLDMIRANWGVGTPPPPAAVPEPAGIILLASAVLVSLLRRLASDQTS